MLGVEAAPSLPKLTWGGVGLDGPDRRFRPGLVANKFGIKSHAFITMTVLEFIAWSFPRIHEQEVLGLGCLS